MKTDRDGSGLLVWVIGLHPTEPVLSGSVISSPHPRSLHSFVLIRIRQASNYTLTIHVQNVLLSTCRIAHLVLNDQMLWRQYTGMFDNRILRLDFEDPMTCGTARSYLRAIYVTCVYKLQVQYSDTRAYPRSS